tara:strand:+ start:4669 stop:5169 length:501 start_codon:yes stop_codon:yes gene_type:complete
MVKNNKKTFNLFDSNLLYSKFNKSSFSNTISSINSSKLLVGISLLLINVGSKYVEMNFSKTQEEALRNGLGRELLIFAMLFMGTHDILLSILMTAAFIVLSNYLFNENCRFCIIPQSMRKINALIDRNKDGIISPEEEKRALDILKRAEDQKKHKGQGEFLKHLGK